MANLTIETIENILESTGSFFAFSNEQVKRATVKGVEYVNLGGGLIAPKEKAQEVFNRIEASNKAKIDNDLKVNGKKKIIHRELANYEAQITGDIDDTVNALKEYGITREEIKAEWGEFWDHCVENDYF